MDQSQITEVEPLKHLGVIFSNGCTWHENLELIKSKASKRINVMRKLKFELYRKPLQTIYFSFIRPLLEYAMSCGIIVHKMNRMNSKKKKKKKKEKIQNEAARIVTGATKLVSINSLLLETGWETLASKRKNISLLYFLKCKIAFPLIILLLLYPPLLAALRHTHYVMLQIYKQYVQILNFIIIPFCRLLSVIGMSFQSKLEVLRASVILRKVWMLI